MGGWYVGVVPNYLLVAWKVRRGSMWTWQGCDAGSSRSHPCINTLTSRSRGKENRRFGL